jgi:hypothetical protein
MNSLKNLSRSVSTFRITLLTMTLGMVSFFAGAAPASKQQHLASVDAPWRSALYPPDWNPTDKKFETDKLIQDFSYAGYRRGEVALPQIRGPIFDAVRDFGADASGQTDSTAAIQKAINAAGVHGGVVYLAAGTFKVAPQENDSYALRIAADNVVLRGAGKNRTFLFNDSTAMRGRSIVLVQSSSANWNAKPEGSPETLVTRDLLTPTTVVPVADVSGFTVGDWIILRADATDEFIAEHNMTDLWAGKNAALGGVKFLRQITAIDGAGSTLRIDVPLRYYLKTRDKARIHKAAPHIEEVGLEHFSIGNREHSATLGWSENDYSSNPENGAYAVHGAYAVSFFMARNCWMTDVASYQPAVNTGKTQVLSCGVGLTHSRSITLQNCDFARPQYGGGGGNGYMYRLTNAQECLLQNCTASHARHGFVFSLMATSGNVIHGGMAQFSGEQVAGWGKTNGTGSDHHMHLSQSNLIDNVSIRQDYFTAAYRGRWGGVPHGQSAVHSVFWNLNGLEYIQGRGYLGDSPFIVQSEQARYGYIIGTRGPAAGVSLAGRDNGGNPERMAPLDHVEGEGRGDRLTPASLYLDQVSRRQELRGRASR